MSAEGDKEKWKDYEVALKELEDTVAEQQLNEDKLKDTVMQLEYMLNEQYSKVCQLGEEVDQKDLLLRNIKQKMGHKAFTAAREHADEKEYHYRQIQFHRQEPDDPPPIEWLVPGYIVKKKPSIIFGKGGSGKSTLALYLAMASIAGEEWIGMKCDNGTRVLYVDFEQDKDEFDRKCKYILNGMNGGRARKDFDWGRIDYWSPEIYLTDDLFWDIIEGETDEVTETNLVIIDSLSIGCNGGDLYTPEVVTPVLNRARKIPATIIFIDHPAKNGSDPYGSVFKLNQVRSVLHLVKDEDTKAVKASLTKENFSGDKPPFSYRMKYSSCRDLPGRDEHNVIEFEAVETIVGNWYEFEQVARMIEDYLDENGGVPGTAEQMYEKLGGEKWLKFKLNNWKKKLNKASRPKEDATKIKGCHELQIFHMKGAKPPKGRPPLVYTTYRRIGPKNEKEIESSGEQS